VHIVYGGGNGECVGVVRVKVNLDLVVTDVWTVGLGFGLCL